MWSVGKSRKKPPEVKLLLTRHHAGFTLLELLVVLGIMGLAYSLAVPVFSRMLPSVVLSSTTEEVVSDLRRARLQAILTGKAVTFMLSDNGLGYDLPDLKINKITKGISLSFLERTRQDVTFTPDGKNSGFTLFLTAGDKSSGQKMQVTSDWVTGRIYKVEVE